MQEEVGDRDPPALESQGLRGKSCKKSSLLENKCAKAITAVSNAVSSNMVFSYLAPARYIEPGAFRNSGPFGVWRLGLTSAGLAVRPRPLVALLELPFPVSEELRPFLVAPTAAMENAFTLHP